MNPDVVSVSRSGRLVIIEYKSGEQKKYTVESEGLAIWLVKYFKYVRYGKLEDWNE